MRVIKMPQVFISPVRHIRSSSPVSGLLRYSATCKANHLREETDRQFGSVKKLRRKDEIARDISSGPLDFQAFHKSRSRIIG